MITRVFYWTKLKICVSQYKFIEQCTSDNKPLPEPILNEIYAVPGNERSESACTAAF